MKDGRFIKLKDAKVGDIISVIDIPYFKEDMRLSWIEKTITAIVFTKSGNRAYVCYDNEEPKKYSSSYGSIGLNSTLVCNNMKFWKEIEAERGWKK